MGTQTETDISNKKCKSRYCNIISQRIKKRNTWKHDKHKEKRFKKRDITLPVWETISTHNFKFFGFTNKPKVRPCTSETMDFTNLVYVKWAQSLSSRNVRSSREVGAVKSTLSTSMEEQQVGCCSVRDLGVSKGFIKLWAQG